MGQWKENTCEDALHIVRGRTDTRRRHNEKKEGFARVLASARYGSRFCFSGTSNLNDK